MSPRRSRNFGLAAFYAYRTYNDSTALQLAISNWQLVYDADFLTTQRAATGILSGGSNFTTNCSCMGPSYFAHVDLTEKGIAKLAGGVFTASGHSVLIVSMTNGTLYSDRHHNRTQRSQWTVSSAQARFTVRMRHLPDP